MTEDRDLLLDAVAGMRIVAADPSWEKKVRARCHSAMALRESHAGAYKARPLRLGDLAAIALLCLYLSALLRDAAWLRGLF